MRKKIRSDAVLLNLPDDRQEQIIEWCDMPKSEDCVGGFAFAREQLAADGLKVSARALSDFYSDWHLRQDIRRAESVEEAVRRFKPEDAKEARLAGEAMLLKLSLAKQEPKLFQTATISMDMRRSRDQEDEKIALKQRQIGQKDKDLALAERRVVLLEKKIEEAKKATEDKTLDAEQRAQRVREILGT